MVENKWTVLFDPLVEARVNVYYVTMQVTMHWFDNSIADICGPIEVELKI